MAAESDKVQVWAKERSPKDRSQGDRRGHQSTTPAGKGERRYLALTLPGADPARVHGHECVCVSRGAKFHLCCQGFQRGLRSKLIEDELTGKAYTLIDCKFYVTQELS